MNKINTKNISSISEKYKILILIAVSLCVAFIFFGQNLKAEMGVIDDNFYLSRGVLENSANVYNNFIEAPEIRSFGKNNRFRLIFWVIQDSQTALWGMNAVYWYLVNIFVFAFFIFTIFYIIWKGINFKWAVASTLFILVPSYFSYIFTRLGTAETWTILGSSIYALGYASAYRKAKQGNIGSNWLEWLAMMLGVFVAVGSKENFSIMFMAIISLLVLLKHYKVITKSAIIASIVMLIFNAYQMAYVVGIQIYRGTDLYQNDLSISHRMLQLLQSLFSEYIIIFVILASVFFVSLFVFLYYFYKKDKHDTEKKKVIYDKLFFTPIIFFMVITAFFLFNVYAYDGKFYITHRYAFPYVFLIQILMLLIVYWFANIKKIYFPNKAFKYANILYIVLIITLSIAVLYNIQGAHIASNKNVQKTTKFQRKLKEIVESVSNQPNQPIVFYSHEPYDFEPMYSTATYFRYYNVNNKIMVVVLDDPNKETRHFLVHLIDVKKGWEKDGGWHNLFVPYSNPDECFAVDFSDYTKDTNCENLGMVWD